jgi:hypothetical protein
VRDKLILPTPVLPITPSRTPIQLPLKPKFTLIQCQRLVSRIYTLDVEGPCDHKHIIGDAPGAFETAAEVALHVAADCVKVVDGELFVDGRRAFLVAAGGGKGDEEGGSGKGKGAGVHCKFWVECGGGSRIDSKKRAKWQTDD